MSDAVIVALRDVAKVVSGYAFKSTEFDSIGVPVIKIKNVRVGDVDLSEVDCVREQNLSLPSRYHALEGDILVSLTGSHLSQPNSVVGRVARMRGFQRPCLINQRVGKLVVHENVDCDRDYLFHYLRTPETTRAIAMMAHGAASQANVSPSQVESLEIRLPPLETQSRIASILGAYDDLIEVNRRRVAILEEIAQGLFKEWFVRLRFPGHELVPLIESLDGPLPKGWSYQDLEEVADIQWGDTTTTKKSYVQEGYPAYSAAGQDGALDHFDYEQTGVVLNAIGSVGRTWLARGKWSCIKNTMRFFAKHDYISTEYLFLATLGASRWPTRGAAQPFISLGDARKLRVLCPDHSLATAFDAVANPALDLAFQLTEANKRLSDSRNLLLPRLISGQLSVEAAPRILLEAA